MRLLIVLILISSNAIAQVGTGQWRLHIPENAIDVTVLGNETYVAYQKGVGVYDEPSGELSVWDAVTGLSDISVACLQKCTSDNSVFIGYENGNVDKIKDNRVTNIPAIKLAQLQGSKKIYKMVEYDEHMYLATGFSIVKIDPKKNEVRDTYYPTNGNQAIVDIVFANDSIYALTSDKMFRGSVNNIALADPAQWTLDSRVSPTSHGFSDIEYTFGNLYVLSKDPSYSGDTVFQITTGGLQVAYTEPFIMEIHSIGTIEDRLLVNYSGGSRLYNSDYSTFINLGLYTNGAFADSYGVAYDGSGYWIADIKNGLVKYNNEYQSSEVRLIGPPKSSMYSMDFQRGRLAVVSGGLAGSQPTFNRGGMYLFEDEEWSLRDQGNMPLWSGDTIHDYLAVSINQSDKEQIAVCNYSNIPLSIMDASGLVSETFTEANSLLEKTTLGNGWTFLSDIEYDSRGNLWVLNSYSNEPLKVYTKDGAWYSFSLGSAAKGRITEDMVVDGNGNKWMAVRGLGMYGYKDQGTIDNSTDDQYINLNIGENSGALPSNEVTALAVDFDNEIWIGTDAGFAVLFNSDNAFDASNYNAQRIKLEFEGNVEYVLGATNITDIEVDGGNRKWFGTANNGIILLSEDGSEILEHHTVDNSPLISNTIVDLEINYHPSSCGFCVRVVIFH